GLDGRTSRIRLAQVAHADRELHGAGMLRAERAFGTGHASDPFERWISSATRVPRRARAPAFRAPGGSVPLRERVPSVRMRSVPLPLLATFLALGACRSVSVDRTGPLLAADRAFCADTQARRIEGWVAAFDANGSQFDEQHRPITGHAAIRAHMAEFFADPANELVWEPDTATISEAGNLGSTSGRFVMSR